MRYLTNTDGGSSKFWEGGTKGSSLVVRYGKIGTDGQTKTKVLKSPGDATAELAKLVREKLAKGYLDEIAKVSAAKPSARGTKEGARGGDDTVKSQARPGQFPFLFFGRRPGDWASGANMGHVYELRFRSPPDPHVRLGIARAFETALDDTPVRTTDKREPWLWAGHWALLCVGERGSASRGADDFFDAIEKAVRAIHGVAPLAEVVFAGVRERGTSDWDRWSHGQQAGPSRNPHFPSHTRLGDAEYEDIDGGAPKERGLKGSADRAFEVERERARDGRVAAAPMAGAAAVGGGASTSGKPTLVKVGPDVFPVEIALPTAMTKLVAEGTPATVLSTPQGGIIALGVKPKSLGQESVLLFSASAKSAPQSIKLPKWTYRGLALAPDGDRAVVVQPQRGEVCEVTLADGNVHCVYTDPRPTMPVGAGYLDRDHVVYLTNASLVVLARTGKGMKESARLKLADMFDMVTAHGRVVVTGRDDTVRILVADGSKIKETAKLSTRAPVIVSHGGRLFLTDHRFANRRTAFFELQGLA